MKNSDPRLPQKAKIKKTSNSSQLPENIQEQLWGYFNETQFAMFELNELISVSEKFEKDILAHFTRLEIIVDMRGEEQLDATYNEQIRRVSYQIRYGLDGLNQSNIYVKHAMNLLPKYSRKLESFIEYLPPKDYLVREVRKRLKQLQIFLENCKEKVDHQEKLIEDSSQRISKYQESKSPSSKARRTNKRKRKIEIFLCHSRRDKPLVRKLYEDLVDAGFKPWLDEIDILPGQEWETEIRHAIERANFFLACLSQNVVDARGYVHKEVKIALDILDKMPEGRTFLIPVRLENCKVPDRLASRQWVDLFAADGLERLIRAFNTY